MRHRAADSGLIVEGPPSQWETKEKQDPITQTSCAIPKTASETAPSQRPKTAGK